MATKPPVRDRTKTAAKTTAGEQPADATKKAGTKTTRPEQASLVQQARQGEDGPEYRNWVVRMPADLIERVWGACTDPDVRDAEDIETHVAFTVRAFEAYLDTLEAKHNSGEHYHAVQSPFGRGRRLSYKR